MKKLKRKHGNWHMTKFPDDIDRIVNICSNRGYDISRDDACWAWEQHSETWAAGWLGLGNNDAEVFDTIMDYMVEE